MKAVMAIPTRMTAKAECLRILPIIAMLTSCLKRGAKVEQMFEKTKN
jgi:hypothetical protein